MCGQGKDDVAFQLRTGNHPTHSCIQTSKHPATKGRRIYSALRPCAHRQHARPHRVYHRPGLATIGALEQAGIQPGIEPVAILRVNRQAQYAAIDQTRTAQRPTLAAVRAVVKSILCSSVEHLALSMILRKGIYLSRYARASLGPLIGTSRNRNGLHCQPAQAPDHIYRFYVLHDCTARLLLLSH